MSELYLKDEKVLTLKDIGGVPGDVQSIDNPELLPICLRKECKWENFKEWLDKRTIPETREGLSAVTEEFGKSWLVYKNYASLPDHYWVKMRTETWKKINFFTNMYSKDIGDMVFKPWTVASHKHNSFSPDLSTGGVLRKRWNQYSDRRSYLVKAGSHEAHQEPLSEVLVSILAEQLNIIPCVKYDLHIEGVTMCSRCDNFVTVDTDLVPAYEIYYYKEREPGETVFQHLLTMCELFDIPDAEEFLKGMVFIDNITGNEDRNLSNIGFIRDINTMKFIGPAPLFDSGNAYWSTKQVSDAVKSKLFGNVEESIVDEYKKKCNMDILSKDFMYKKLIRAYPCLNPLKKDNLIEAITKRNARLVKNVGLFNER